MAGKLGVMICGHGSRDQGAVDEFAAVSLQLRRRLPHYEVDYGYLEFARPIIRDGLDRLRAKGVTEVLAIPGMLFAAGRMLARYAGGSAWRGGTAMMITGAVLIAAIMALGG